MWQSSVGSAAAAEFLRDTGREELVRLQIGEVVADE
jgi:hypothetical protein